MKKGLVSIITPVYNAEKFLEDTIKCVKEQTYSNWEIIFIDDCSTDSSAEIINKYLSNNIKYYKQDKNSGPALARNKGIELAEGQYIAYLDADDFWEKDKLEKQINFMNKKKCAFSFTGYEFTNELGKPNGKKVSIPLIINYDGALKNTIIWTTTVMFDLKRIPKQYIMMPDVKSEDTASWWKILRQDYKAYGINEVLAYYRRHENSLSANKLIGIKKIWNLYRNEEHLSLIKSANCFVHYAFNTVLKRI